MMLFYLAGRQLHIELDELANVLNMTNRRPRDPTATRIERLALTFERPRLEGSTLYLDALGLMHLLSVIGPSCKTRRALHMRICEYFPGEPNLLPMLRATARTMFGEIANPAIGEEQHYQRLVEQQLGFAAHQITHH